jgi:hypothetical protein
MYLNLLEKQEQANLKISRWKERRLWQKLMKWRLKIQCKESMKQKVVFLKDKYD